ncbi:MAG: BatA domain-containing protein [Thermoguttaceae bacterium]|nr:BatA domain-containing protein [Thermoguttaceae bacterium]
MTFLTWSFLVGGLAAATIPVLLHLLMQSKPRRIEFPPLRFIRQKFEQNRRRFVLKNFLLLAMRIGLLVLLGCLLARPSIRFADDGENSFSLGRLAASAVGSSEAPVAMAFVFDTSVRMEYKFDNKTSLDRARETALKIISSIPPESQIAVLNSTTENDSFQVDLLAAQERIERLETHAGGRTVSESVLKAIDLLATSTCSHRELFVLTDCTLPGWPASFAPLLKQALARSKRSRSPQQEETQFYFVDTGSVSRQNTGISHLGLSAQTVSARTPLRLDVSAFHSGQPRQTTIDLYLVDDTNVSGTQPQAKTADATDASSIPTQADTHQSQADKSPDFPPGKKLFSNPIDFPKGDSVRVTTFRLEHLSPGIHQGYVRLAADDALQADNVRWFTVESRPLATILLVSTDPVEKQTLFVREALCPEEYRKSGMAPFETEAVSTSKLAAMSLDELRRYKAVFLLDPDPLSPQSLKLLSDYVQTGGGLGFFPGRHAYPASAFQTAEWIQLLGGKLTSQVRVPDWDVWLNPSDASHPALSGFRSLGEGYAVPWSNFTVGRYWQYTELSKTAAICAYYSDGRPALYSHSFGQGTVVVSGSPFSELPNQAPWNHFASGEASWIFVVLLDGIARTLVSGGSPVFNYVPNEMVLCRPEIKNYPDSAVLVFPNRQRFAIPVDTVGRQIRFSGTNRTGLYRILASPNAQGESVNTGFSVNYSSGSFDLTKRGKEEIIKMFDGTRLNWIDNVQQIERTRSQKRVGNELFGILVVLFGVLLLVECAYSNRFYGERPAHK